jgi:hypothetical protein
MALTEAQRKKIEEEERHASHFQSAMADALKSSQKHGIPALLSFFIPGLGQMVKGEVGKGIGILEFIPIKLQIPTEPKKSRITV